MPTSNVINDLKSLANPTQAKNLQRFFKTGKGEYGEGDVFLGLKVPQVRQVVKKYWHNVSLAEVEKLLRSKYHEVRQCALFILVEKFKNTDRLSFLSSSNRMKSDIGDPKNKTGSRIRCGMTQALIRKQVFDIYIANTKYINNWDLVDLTAGHIVGGYLDGKPKDLLYKFAKSNNLWQRRIAAISTLYGIVFKGESEETIKIAKMLLHDPHDLIHKAVGWMLREVGKRCDEKILTDFLDQYSTEMPRTMLRYSIEKLDENKRKHYLSK